MQLLLAIALLALAPKVVRPVVLTVDAEHRTASTAIDLDAGRTYNLRKLYFRAPRSFCFTLSIEHPTLISQAVDVGCLPAGAYELRYEDSEAAADGGNGHRYLITILQSQDTSSTVAVRAVVDMDTKKEKP